MWVRCLRNRPCANMPCVEQRIVAMKCFATFLEERFVSVFKCRSKMRIVFISVGLVHLDTQDIDKLLGKQELERGNGI